MLIKDLIEIRPLQSVIQIAGRENKEEVIPSFVWTDDVRKYLEDLFKKISLNKGGGIFLKGHYGTGKSHLLSYLAKVAEDWSLCTHPLTKEFQKFETFPISLTEWSSSISLEEIVSQAMGIEYTKTNRNEVFAKVVESYRNKISIGFIILFDELSEFLKSKHNASDLSEDIRFLQFLAEFSEQNQSWVIAAIQENIEGIGYASRETSLKLKDRYPNRWNLTNLHIEQMLPKRLILHKPGSDEYIENLFNKMNKLWPETFSSLSLFVNIYPLHPSCLDFLMGMGQLFSEHRGALRFVEQILCGNNLELDQPFLNNNKNHLICPDLILDFFEQRLRENPDLNDYYNKAWLHLNSRAEKVIEEEYLSLAKRCLKVIILSSLDSRREGITIKELNACLLHHIGSDVSLAENFLLEKICQPISNQANYLEVNNDLLCINLKHKAYELLGHVLENKVAELDFRSQKVWDKLISIMTKNPLNFSSYWENGQRNTKVKWLNTNRDITIGWNRENDFCDITIALPGQFDELKNKDGMIWLARNPDENELITLKTIAAILLFVEEDVATVVEKQARLEALKRIDAEKTDWQSVLEKLFINGKWFLNRKETVIDIQWSTMRDLEGALEEPVYELMSTRHPLFRMISPKIPWLNERMLTDLVDGFISVGNMTEAELKKIKCLELVQGVLRPMQCVQKVKNQYRFIWDKNHSVLVKAIEFSLEKNQYCLDDTQIEMEKGEFGLPKMLFNFLIWSLCKSEHYTAIRDSLEVNADKLSFQNIESITLLKKSPTLSEYNFNKLLSSRFFNEADQSFSGLSLQRETWLFVNMKIRSIEQCLQVIEQVSFFGGWAFAEELIIFNKNILLEVTDLLDFENTPSFEGLELLISKIELLDSAEKSYYWCLDFSKSYKKYEEDIEKYFSYCNDETLDQLPANENWLGLIETRRSLLNEYEKWVSMDEPWNSIDLWIANVNEFIGDYKRTYGQSHENYYKNKVEKQEILLRSILIKNGVELKKDWADNYCSRNVEYELNLKPFCRCSFDLNTQSVEENIDYDYSNAFSFLERQVCEPSLLNSFKRNIIEKNWVESQSIWEECLKNCKDKNTCNLSIAKLAKSFCGKTYTKHEFLVEIEKYIDEKNSNFFKIEE